jgi:hypothetical protein
MSRHSLNNKRRPTHPLLCLALCLISVRHLRKPFRQRRRGEACGMHVPLRGTRTLGRHWHIAFGAECIATYTELRSGSSAVGWKSALDKSCWRCPPVGGSLPQRVASAAKRFLNHFTDFFSQANWPCAGDHSGCCLARGSAARSLLCWLCVPLCASSIVHDAWLSMCRVCTQMPRDALSSGTRATRIPAMHPEVHD